MVAHLNRRKPRHFVLRVVASGGGDDALVFDMHILVVTVDDDSSAFHNRCALRCIEAASAVISGPSLSKSKGLEFLSSAL